MKTVGGEDDAEGGDDYVTYAPLALEGLSISFMAAWCTQT